MKSLGQAGSALPRLRPGDYERTLAIVAGLGNDESVKAKLTELRDAEVAHEAAREAAEVATSIASRREDAARLAEADAESEQSALATETAASAAQLRAARASHATEGQRLTELADDLTAKELDLKTREGALRRAFDAYTGE